MNRKYPLRSLAVAWCFCALLSALAVHRTRPPSGASGKISTSPPASVPYLQASALRNCNSFRPRALTNASDCLKGLAFEENAGQVDSRIRFIGRSSALNVSLRRDGIELTARSPKAPVATGEFTKRKLGSF